MPALPRSSTSEWSHRERTGLSAIGLDMGVASAAQFCSTTRSLRRCAPWDWTLALGFGGWRFFSDGPWTWSGDAGPHSLPVEGQEISQFFVRSSSTRADGSSGCMLLYNL